MRSGQRRTKRAYRHLPEKVVDLHEGIDERHDCRPFLVRLGLLVASVQPQRHEVDIVRVEAPRAVQAVADRVPDVGRIRWDCLLGLRRRKIIKYYDSKILKFIILYIVV